ncbi:MAG: hypothetical protein MR920_04125 [Oscillospiraceae bacterium]|nr:hypothetical protein [Oscillospiraceae bacterium]
MTKKIIALVLALCFVFAFAACKKDKDNSDTTTGEPNTSANGETIANDESSEAESVSGDESTEAQTDASGNTVAPATEKNTQGSGSQGGISTASKPSTKAEIVAYFNKAINDVKPNAKSVTRVSETNYRSGNITGVPSIVDKLVGGIDSFVDGQLKKNSKGSETFSNSAAIKANFPVENESWSSKLTANDVASATCTEAGGVYTITIKTVADKASSNVHHGSGHAPKVFSVVLPSVINDQFSSGVLKSVAKTFKIGTAQMEYPSSTVTVKVDAKTSRVINATYDAKWTIHLPLGDEMVVLPFGTKTIYNIAY